MTPQEKLIKVAEAEVGYLEKASNANLDSATANAGQRNYTKYARDLDALGDFYNGRKNGYDWCDVFVDWCFVQAFGKEKALKLLEAPLKSCGAGVKFSANYYKGDLYKNAGQFHTSTPQPGDQIFFGTDTVWQHTGLVYKVDSKYVYTIEGNTSGASGVVSNGGGVAKKKYLLTYNRIKGYGRPDWSIVGGEVEQPQKEPAKAESKPLKLDVALNFSKSYNKAYTVKAAGLNLRTGAGANKTLITVMGNGTKFRCYGYYNKAADGSIWLYGIANGKTGYCHKGYLK